MSQRPSESELSPAHAALQRIDTLCDAFEAQWQAGDRPDINAFLESADDRDRAALYVELLRLDIDYRRRRGEMVDATQHKSNDLLAGQTIDDPASTSNGDACHDLPTVMLSLGSLGEYQLLEKLGEGGMGSVYKARHRKLKRMVAIKMLPRKMKRHPRALLRFEREMQIIGALDHPNIVRATDAGEVDGTHYLVMDYVDGQDLSKRLKDEGPLSVTQAVEFVRQTAAGLAYAHAQGVVHRDVKPANLLVSSTGDVKILDLGLARLEKEIDQKTTEFLLTRTDQVMGTFDYMSPEQAVQTRDVDHRTDIYSLGCTLFTLLTGRPIFAGKTPVEKVMAHRNEAPPSLSEVFEDVPPALNEVFQQMVAKRPDDRFESMDAVIAALAKIKAPSPSAARKQRNHATLFAEQTPRKRRWAMWWLAGFFVLCILITAVVPKIFSAFTARELSDAVPPSNALLSIQEESKLVNNQLNAPDIAPEESGPTRAVFPLGDSAIKSIQQTWAEHLGVPVTRELELAGDVTLSMVLIPPGEFIMGSSVEDLPRFREQASALNDHAVPSMLWGEQPEHRVTMSKAYYLSKCELTRQQWDAVMDEKGTEPAEADLPMTDVSWLQVEQFTKRLNAGHADAGLKFQIPTEAQWEYACRAGTDTDFSSGNDIEDLTNFAWQGERSSAGPHPVGKLQPNAWGLYDMHGNVWEWCADWYDTYHYRTSGRYDPAGPLRGNERVVRGGSWRGSAAQCRSRLRNHLLPGDSKEYIGVRLLATISE